MTQPTSGAHSGASALNKIYGHVKDIETITATKTLTLADSGKTLLVNYDSGATITLTLPTPTAGCFFEIRWIADMDDDDAAVAIVSPGGNGTLQGIVQCEEADGTGHAAEIDNGSHSTLTVDGNPNVEKGGVLELISDGTNWYISGKIFVDAGATATDSITFS